MPAHIRPLEKDDKSHWENLWQQYNTFYKREIPQAITETTFARFLDTNVKMYAAVAIDDEGTAIGFVHWYPHPSTSTDKDVVYLQDLFVDAKTRNAGVGRQLIEHVYSHSRERDVQSVYWHTQHFNHRAQLLYVRTADKTDFVQYRKVL